MIWFKKRKLGVKPASQEAALVAPSSGRPEAQNGKTPLPPQSSPVLIEREHEMNKLLDMWHGARQGRGCVALLAGEAGYGKSSLLSSFIARVEAEEGSHKIARASCSAQTGRDEPFWPFADVMNQLVAAPARTLAADILDTVLEVAPSWVSIVPVAGDLVGAGLQTAKVVRERTKSSPGPNPDKLLREYIGVLESVSEKQPVLIAIDDLHWSDAGSVRLLSHLSKNIAGLRVMLLCAYRPSDVAVEDHLFEKLVDEIVRYNPDAEITLPPLSPQGVNALLNQCLPANKFPPAFTEQFYQRTGGAPLFVLESLRLMQTRGEIRRDEADGRWMLVRELTEEDLPRSVEAVIHKRLERLPDELRRALALAAVQGVTFETAVLAAVMGRDEVDVLRMLEPAEHPHDIIEYVGDVEVGDNVTSRFRFNSTLFQRELLETLRGRERMLAHRKTAAGIEHLWGEQAREYAAQLAVHYEKGRMWDEAARYMILSAQRARRTGETENGIARFERAETLLRRWPTGPSIEQQIEIDEGLSYLYDLDARYDLAEERIRHALALDAMHHKLDWRRSATLQIRLANLTGDKGRYLEALHILQNLYANLSKEAREYAGSIEAFRLRAALAATLTQVGRDEEGIQLAQDSLNALAALPRGGQDREEEDAWRSVEVELRSALAASYFGRGEYARAIALAEEVLDVARKLDLTDTVMMIQDRLADMYLAVGRYDKAQEYAQLMERTGREVSNETLVAMAHVVYARILRLQDDNEGALRELDRAEALIQALQWFPERPQMMAIRAAALIGLNRLDEAQALLVQAEDLAANSGIREWQAFARFMRARLELALGHLDTAADMASEAARIFNEEWAYFEEAQALRVAARAHREAGDRSAAAHCYRQAIAIFERIGNAPQATSTRQESGL